MQACMQGQQTHFLRPGTKKPNRLAPGLAASSNPQLNTETSHRFYPRLAVSAHATRRPLPCLRVLVRLESSCLSLLFCLRRVFAPCPVLCFARFAAALSMYVDCLDLACGWLGLR